MAARLVVVLAAVIGMAGLTVATAGAVGPRVLASRAHSSLAHVGAVHIESVSTPVLVTASELAQAEVTTGGASPTTPPPPPPPPPPATGPAPARAASGTSASPGGGGTDMGTFLVTCYDIRGRTASGDEAGPESVAVDPSVIPLGSEIYIDGVGTRRADDTGGGVHGHHIDIWASSYSACAAFGRQYRDVHRMS